APALAAPLEARSRREGMVNVRRGVIEKERLVSMLANPGQRLFRQRGREFLLAIERVRRLAARNAGHGLLGKRLRGAFPALDDRIGGVQPHDAMILDEHEWRVAA